LTRAANRSGGSFGGGRGCWRLWRPRLRLLGALATSDEVAVVGEGYGRVLWCRAKSAAALVGVLAAAEKMREEERE